jgi:hypothetical protein
MRLLKSCRLEPFCRRRQYIGKYLVGIGVAAALMALCVGWLVYDAAAQTNDAPDVGTLTVGKCLREANISAGPVGQALIKEGIIEENLLPTMVTNDMCEDILKRAPDDSSVQTLVSAQNYIQEIKLIENSIRGAAGEAAAKGSDRHLFGDEFLVSTMVMVQADKSPAQRQYSDDETPRGGGSDEMGVKPIRRKAANVSATAESVVAKGNASIAGMLNQIEAAALEGGLSRSDAARSARCGIEQALLNAISKELFQRQYIKFNPDPIPKEIEYGDTVTVKLLVSGEVRGLYEKLEGQYEKVAEASEAEEGCVVVVKSMKARLLDRRFSIEPNQGQEMRPITHDTTWSWDVTANAGGKNVVDLFVGHVLQLGETEVEPRWVEPAPVHHATITVKVNPLGEESNLIGRNWQWLLPVGIALAAAATWLVWMLRKREHDR